MKCCPFDQVLWIKHCHITTFQSWRKELSSKFYLFAPGERWVALQTGKCSVVERLTFIRKEVTPFPYHENEKVSPLSPWRK